MSETFSTSVSFFKLLEDPGFMIEIPIIQRDYAQGRDSASNLRNNFLNTIKKHLDDGRPLNLDFVYGTIEKVSKEDSKYDRFIPLDGQQRLTTLFLMHWYLGWKSGRIDHVRSYLGTENSRFTYETRTSSKDFCNRLISGNLPDDSALNIKGLIEDQPWYYLNWKTDPSIKAMLNTLVSIEQIFTDPEFYYDQLVKAEQLISFQYIELNNFGLTDQLYIKMNSRGKPLTKFENLKANVEKIFIESSEEVASWFAQNVDNKWTDLLWNLRENSITVDELIMNFVRIAVTNLYASKKDYDKDHLRRLLDDKSFDFYLLQNTNSNDFETLNQCFQLLDQLCGERNQLKTPLSGENIVNSTSIIETGLGIEGRLTYEVRIQFAALCSYLVEHGEDAGIDDWMRLIRNLSENSRIDDQEIFANAIQTIHKLLPHANDISSHIKGLEITDFVGYSNEQSQEEILKAEICDDEDWKSKIHKIEDHSYLRGNVGFLLEFSGRIERNEENGIWEMGGKDDPDLFQKYIDRMLPLMRENGITEFEDHLFRRALLSKGDYTNLAKGHRHNYSFLVNADRDVSWKRFFKTDSIEPLKLLLDDLDVNSIEGSLQTMIDDFNEDDWRYYFIKNPELIKFTGRDLLIRYRDPENDEDDPEIYLLEKTQMNGMHREYFSFALAKELEKDGFEVVYHADALDDIELKYIESINDREIQIYYWPWEEEDQKKGYWVKYGGKEEEWIGETLVEAKEWVKEWINQEDQ